jgi:hypothetical protein
VEQRRVPFICLFARRFTADKPHRKQFHWARIPADVKYVCPSVSSMEMGEFLAWRRELCIKDTTMKSYTASAVGPSPPSAGPTLSHYE